MPVLNGKSYEYVVRDTYGNVLQLGPEGPTASGSGGGSSNITGSVKDIITSLQPAYAASFAMAMDAVAPGWKGIMSQLEGGIRDLLGGRLPEDVTRMIESTMAEKNLQGGRYGQIADAATARTLGMTSLDMTYKGMDAATKYLSVARDLSPQVTDLQSLISGAQTYNLESKRLAAQQQELSARMAESARQEADATALRKLQLLLGAEASKNELAERKYEFDSQLDWKKQVSNWNRQYEQWATGQNADMMRMVLNSKEKIAGQEAATFSESFAKYMNQFGQRMQSGGVPAIAGGNDRPISPPTPDDAVVITDGKVTELNPKDPYDWDPFTFY